MAPHYRAGAVLADAAVPTGATAYVLTYIVPGLIIASLIAFAGYLTRLNRRLNDQDRALALIVQQVMPAGQPSLRDVLNTTQIDMANLKGQITAQSGHQPAPHHPGGNR